MTKAQKAEREDAIAQLREWIKPGDTIYTILRQVSRSGMSRQISVVLPTFSGPAIESVAPGGKPADYVRMDAIKIDFLHPNWSVAKAIGARLNRSGANDAIVMGGCGMDMGFALVYELAHVLYGKGYQCLGKGKCPSNYHRNHRDSVRCPNNCLRSGHPDDVPGSRFYSTGEDPRVPCTSCDRGYVPNPDGPERFDLVHVDGYALKQQWL